LGKVQILQNPVEISGIVANAVPIKMIGVDSYSGIGIVTAVEPK
jgi:hypothetical protein